MGSEGSEVVIRLSCSDGIDADDAGMPLLAADAGFIAA
jgi:hypothetical protein